MKTHLLSSLKLTFFCIILFVVIYPTTIWLIALIAAPNKGKGEIVVVNGKLVGYVNVGQNFTSDKYFWSRPSAVNYNAAGSAGSNKGPTNPEYLNMVRSRIDTFLVHNPSLLRSQVPSEMVTASGSGLDPHISIESANVQVKRISVARGIPEGELKKMIMENQEKPLFGFMGPVGINVLKLNLALDQQKSD